MRQTSTVAPSSLPVDTCERSRRSGAAGIADDIEAISDDDAPMVAAGGADAASCARAAAPAITSHLSARQRVVDLPQLRAETGAAEQILAGSKRSSVAAELIREPQVGFTNRKDSSVDAAAKVGGELGADCVLDIDDLDSLFAL